jgi:hypothetical protein
VNFPGIFPARDSLLVDIEEAKLRERVSAYFDPQVSHEEMKRLCPQAMTTANRYEPVKIREYLQRRGFLPEKVVRYAYRPFDLRWLYWEPETKLLNEKRAEAFGHVFDGNTWLAAVKQNRKEFDPPTVVKRHASLHIIERGANLFPLLLPEAPGGSLFPDEAKVARQLGNRFVNLSDAALAYLADRGGVTAAPDLFYHIAAVLHASAYATENAGALRQDWPRVPLPETREGLTTSANLGRQVVALLDTEVNVAGVVSGKVRPELKGIGVVSRVGGGPLVADAGELDFTAGWGFQDGRGAIMPGQGRVASRAYSPEERAALVEGGAALGLNEAAALACLGVETTDVYLSDVAYWRNVPAKVWGYRLGGYQVMKKWLSYREKGVLGRGLTLAEVSEVTAMARRIAALLLLSPTLDANYREITTSPFQWGSHNPLSQGRDET